MFLFSITGSLFWFFLMNTFFKFDGVRIRDFLLPVAKGMIVAIPVLFIHWIYYRSISPCISVVMNFFYLFLANDGLLTVFAIAVPVFLSLLRPGDESVSSLRALSGYFAGFFIMVGMRDLFISNSHNGFLDLFMAPLMRIGVIALLSIFLSEANEEMGIRRLRLFGVALLTPFIANFHFVFHFYPLLNIYTYFIALLFLVGGNFLYILKIRKRIL